MIPPLTTTLDELASIIHEECGDPMKVSHGIRQHRSTARKIMAAQPAPPTQAVRLLRNIVEEADGDTLHPTTIAPSFLVEARRYLAATEGGTP